MSYTEVQKRGTKEYYYRVKSMKKKGKVTKKRIYLGENIPKEKIKNLECKADAILNESLNTLLSKEERKELEKVKRAFKKLPKQTFQNRYESFLAKCTYDSNAIEGNTLDLKETSYILFEKRTPPGKSLREINEVLNHKQAFEYILSYKQDLNQKFICEIQKRIVQNTLRKELENQIGKYRTVQVYIRGTEFIPTRTEEVRREMKALLRWYNQNKTKIHPLILAVHFHVAFEAIHPFIDGYGRTGRLLLNFILNQNNFPMITIPNQTKLEYYQYLAQAQQKNNLKPFLKFIYTILSQQEKYI